MQYLITDLEWEKLHVLLNESSSNTMARLSAQACIYRFSSRLSKSYRTFSWAMLPSEFYVSGKTAHRYYTKWIKSGNWFKFWDMLIVHRYNMAIPREPDLQLETVSPLIGVVLELERAYHYFNHRFLGNTLPSSIRIAVESTQGSSKKLGYFARRTWHSDNDHGHHIAICPNSLGNSKNALEVLLHEMVHAKNATYELEDTDGRTQYHTIDFRDSALLLGLLCTKVKYHGFANTELGERALDAIAILKPVEKVFAAMTAY